MYAWLPTGSAQRPPSHSVGKDSEAQKARQQTAVGCFFYKSVAEDPEKVGIDSTIPEVQSVDAFPETIEIELTNIQIPMIPHKHDDEKSELHLDPLQQFLGMLRIELHFPHKTMDSYRSYLDQVIGLSFTVAWHGIVVRHRAPVPSSPPVVPAFFIGGPARCPWKRKCPCAPGVVRGVACWCCRTLVAKKVL